MILRKGVILGFGLALAATTVPGGGSALGAPASPAGTTVTAAPRTTSLPGATALPGGSPAARTAAMTPARAAREQSDLVVARWSRDVIAAPRSGKAVRSAHVRIAVRGKYSVERARLNGALLSSADFANAGRRQVLLASSSHGLRHGRNTLTVVARNTTTHRLRKQRVHFALRHRLPLTGAGRDLFAESGARVDLPGRVRLHPTALRKLQRTGSAAKPTIRWSVVRAPGRDPKLRRSSRTEVRLRTTRSGRYVLRARSAFGGARTTDRVTLSVAAAPMQNLDTDATRNGTPGISIGDQFYPAGARGDSPQWQVLVLDSRTAAQVSNTTYGGCPNNGQVMCAFTSSGSRQAWLPDDLKTLVPASGDPTDSNRIVIAVSHRFYAAQHSPSEMFPSIGAPANLPVANSTDNPWAIIGIPGMNAGSATVNESGALRGYLMRGPSGKFNFGFGDRSTFDSRDGDNCNTVGDACTVGVRVGNRRVPVQLPYGEGFAVVVADASTLQVTATESFSLLGTPAVVSKNLDSMTGFLNGLSSHALVVISSAGPDNSARMDPYGLDYNIDADKRDKAKLLGEAISNLGGTRNAFLQSTRVVNGVGGGDYTLVGWPGAGEGNARELREEGARLSGALSRNNLNLYRPVNVSVDGVLGSEALTGILYRPQGAMTWPGADDPKFQAAIRYIADSIVNDPQMGSDPRAAYWTTYPRLADKTGALDGRYWVALSNDRRLTGTLKAPAGATFDDSTLNAAARQLTKEFRWVGYTRIYFELLQAPYVTTQQSTAFLNRLQQIATDLQVNADSSRAKAPVEVDWATIVAALIEVLGAVLAVVLPGSEALDFLTEAAAKEIIELSAAVVSSSFEVVGASVDAANKHSEQDEANKQADDDRAYEVKAGNLIGEIIDGFNQTELTMDMIGDVITNDYAKLQDFGNWVTSCPAASVSPAGKPIDPETCASPVKGAEVLQDVTLAGLKRTGAARMYGQLLPVAYDVMEVPQVWGAGGYGDPEGNWDAARFGCVNYYPFADDKLPTELTGKPGSPGYGANIHLFKPFLYRSRESISLDGNAKNAPTFQSYAIGIVKDGYWTYPDPNSELGDSLTDNLLAMFTPLTTNDGWTTKGLGMSPADFVMGIPDDRLKKWSFHCGGWQYGANDVPAPLN